jgi:hypothetical protein
VGLAGLLCLGGQAFEPGGVALVVSDGEGIAGGADGDGVAEGGAQARHVGAQAVDGRPGWVVAPEGVGEQVGTDRLARPGGEHGQDQALAAAADGDPPARALAGHCHRPEYPHPHGSIVRIS